MQYLFYLLLGLLPSLIWLSFYLRKDQHPEPNSLVITMFVWGMLLAPLAIVLELFLIWLLTPHSNPLNLLFTGQSTIWWKILLAATLIPALVEEWLKYSAVRFKIVKNSEFDEPTDAILYCIIVGLGFAAVENLLILFKISFPDFGQALGIIALRFVGATLVHALASAMVGYWLSQAILNPAQRKKLVAIGLSLAIIFHTCYNYLIVTAAETGRQDLILLIIALLLVLTALLVSYYFRKIKKQQSICKIQKI